MARARIIGCRKLSVAGVALALAGASVLAEPVRIDGSVEGRYSDNMERTPTDETSDIETITSLGVSYRSDPGRCNADLSSRFGYGYWLDDTYDPEIYSNLDFFGDCQMTDNVSWELTDQLRDVDQNSREADTPNNTTRKNVFRTGPVLNVRLSQVDETEFRVAYQQTDYSEPEEPDSERYLGSAAWNHMFSSGTTAGLFAEMDRAELDTGQEIDTDTLAVTFTKQWVVTRLSGSIGASQLESRLNGSGTEAEAIVGDLLLEREINPSTLLSVQATRELTDQTSNLDIQIGSFVFNLEQTAPVEVTAIRGSLDKRFSNGSRLLFTAYGAATDYLLTDLTDYRAGLGVNYRRPVSQVVNFTSDIGYDFYDYGGEIDSNDHVIDVAVGLDYQMSRKLVVNGRVGHERRESEVASREYNENWILLGLSYQFR
ncbi:outer membrane beta-barrel protein [Marinobacter pelagius]|uniref:outer membrane beta-barrel protein n=1 Tax=Marinobacter sp. C7 TaxID=2951363 RepID=UPI001EF0B73E|nr:outer membrane beta-barrel protein [Marinobacter sp. C7]MCG7199461.1 outer membrane beta-barrel protein [Marinobacter sp. C7]